MNIAGKKYTSDNLVDLVNDLVEMEGLYRSVVDGVSRNIEAIKEMDTEEIGYQNSPKKRAAANTSNWVRNPSLRDLAISRSGVKCDTDSSHATFMADANQCMKGHHLIPIDFRISL